MDLRNALLKFKAAGKRVEWFQCVQALYEEWKDYDTVLEFRREIKKQVADDPKKVMDLMKRSYLLTARDSFDDYMIFIEWEREPEKRFWLPRRDILLPIAQAMQDLEDDKLDLLAVSLPPGTGKTTLKTYLLSHVIGKYPDKPNLDSGHSGAMTSSTYSGVLQILTDPDYLWGDVFPGMSIITDAKNLRIDVDKRHRFSSLTCRSIDGSLTGATRAEMLLTADDLVSGIEEALSKERLDSKWAKYTSDLKTRKKSGAKELHIATRWSVHDVIGRLEDENEGNPRARFIVIPALNEKNESNFEYKYDVGFNTEYFLDMKKALDPVTFKALFQNQPIEREGLLYDPDSLRWYERLPEGEPDAVLMVCDTAEGGGDDTVMPVFAVYGGEHYLIDCVCSNELPDVTDILLSDCIIRNKVKRGQFESNSAGGRTADKVSDMVKQRGHYCSITKKRTTQHKLTKILVESPWVKENCLFLDPRLIEPGSMYASFIRKMTSFTNSGKEKHDDVPDSLAMYAQYYQKLTNYIKVGDRKRCGL